MLSIYPIGVDIESEEEFPLWRSTGYFDDAKWIVTYQRNEFSPIDELFIGEKQSAIDFFDDFIENWG